MKTIKNNQGIEITEFTGRAKIAFLIDTNTGERIARASSKWLKASECWEYWKSHKMDYSSATVNRSRSRKPYATAYQALARFF